MASNVSQRPDECQICLNNYDNNRRPRSTSCGHSFCSECLEDSLKFGVVKCPRCRKELAAISVKDFPINYDMEAVMTYRKVPSNKESDKCTCTSARGIAKKLEMLKLEQDKEARQLLETSENCIENIEYYINALESCLDNQKSLKIWICKQNCQCPHAESEKTVKRELLRLTEVNSSLIVKSDNLEDQLEILKTLNSVESMVNYIDDTDKCIAELEDAVKLKEEICNKMKMLFKLLSEEDDPESSEKVKKYFKMFKKKSDPILASCISGSISDHLDMQDGKKLTALDFKNITKSTRKFIEAGKVYAVIEEDSIVRSAKIGILDGKVMMYAFRSEAAPKGACIVPFSEVKSLLDPQSTLVFLFMYWGSGTADGYVFIRVDPDTSYGQQFVMLCSGEKGPSYRTSRSYKVYHGIGESLYCGRFESEKDKEAATLIKGTKAGNEYYWPCPAGSIAGAGSDGPEFIIIHRGWGMLPYWHKTGFGKIESGLDYVGHAINECWNDLGQIQVMDCGVVFGQF